MEIEVGRIDNRHVFDSNGNVARVAVTFIWLEL